MKIAIIRDVKTPARGSNKSAGLDFFIPNDYNGNTHLAPGESVNIPSGIKASIPPNYMLVAFNKSGVALKKSLVVGACVVDEDYQGEIHLNLLNVGDESIEIFQGEKIVQFVLVPVIYPNITIVPLEELYYETTERGEGGFGSTGSI